MNQRKMISTRTKYSSHQESLQALPHIMTLATAIIPLPLYSLFFFLNDPAPPDISPLPLPDALPISLEALRPHRAGGADRAVLTVRAGQALRPLGAGRADVALRADRAHQAHRAHQTLETLQAHLALRPLGAGRAGLALRAHQAHRAHPPLDALPAHLALRPLGAPPARLA